MMKCGKQPKTDEEWLATPWNELGGPSRRKVLLLECNNKCSLCGFDKTRDDGRTILEIDHIDGDHTNNLKNNLRVLCPNCHALTPNFRNWGRQQSTRIRKGTKNYERVRNTLHEQEEKYRNYFISSVKSSYGDGSIDYTKFGWVQKLADKLNESPQSVGRRIRKLLPDFYLENCFRKGAKR